MSVTRADDLTIHQGYGTIDQVESGNPRWFESVWFHLGLTAGGLSVAGRVGAYPVANMMDATAAVSAGGRQWNVRAARVLQHDRTRMEAGPIRAEILEPFRRWRFVLDAGDDPSQPRFDLEILSDHYPMEVSAPVMHRRAGRHAIWEMWQYVQTGRVRGTVTANEQEHALNEETAWAVRDRSWGVRPIFGQTPLKAPMPDSLARSSTWLAARFPARDLWLWLMEPVEPLAVRAFGNLADDTGRVRLDGSVAGLLTDSAERVPRVLEADLQLAFEGPAVAGGGFTAHDSDGRKWDVAVRPLSTVYSRGLGYGNPSFRQGEYNGNTVQRDVNDLADSGTVAELTGNPAGHINPYGVEQFCEFTCDGERGYGVVRVGI